MTSRFLALTLSLAMLGCQRDRRVEPPPNPGFSDEGRAAEQRVGRYLQDAVVSDRLRTCWGQIQGEGVVAIDLLYSKSGENWTFQSAKATRSSLAKGLDATAQQCIEESARGTSFTVDSNETLEKAASQFVVRLGWPVPLPPAGTETSSAQMARLKGPDGEGTITTPGCSTCESNPNPPYGYKCVTKSSGSEVDCEEIQSNICATTPKACLRGGFGGTRGVVMF